METKAVCPLRRRQVRAPPPYIISSSSNSPPLLHHEHHHGTNLYQSSYGVESHVSHLQSEVESKLAEIAHANERIEYLKCIQIQSNTNIVTFKQKVRGAISDAVDAKIAALEDSGHESTLLHSSLKDMKDDIYDKIDNVGNSNNGSDMMMMMRRMIMFMW